MIMVEAGYCLNVRILSRAARRRVNADDFSPAGRKQIVTIFGAADIDLPYITLGEDFADFRTGECLAFTHDFDCLSISEISGCPSLRRIVNRRTGRRGVV